MTLDAVVRTRLLAQPALTSLVGVRIYSLILPQHAQKPAVRVQQIGREEPMHLRGPVPLFRARVQIDSVGYSMEDAAAVDAAVDGNGLGPAATGLRGFIGSIGSPAVFIKAILPADVRDGYDAEELKQYRISRDYFVWFTS